MDFENLCVDQEVVLKIITFRNACHNAKQRRRKIKVKVKRILIKEFSGDFL